MMIKCLIIDDEPIALEKLSNYVDRVPYLELQGRCSSAHEASAFMEDNKVDAIFIDVNMPDMNGLEFVRSLTEPPLVVFVTAYSDYAVESYKVRAVDYLLKPYGFEDFQRAACNLKKQYELVCNGKDKKGSEPESIFMKVDYRYVRVVLNDILYIEGMNEYLRVHIRNSDPILVHTTFKQMNECLPSNFVQIHRSYVINMDQMLEVERSMVLMSNGTRLSVSDGNKEAFMQYLAQHSLRR